MEKQLLELPRRSGKTSRAVDHLITKALESSTTDPVYLYLTQSIGQIKRIVLPRFKTYSTDLNMEITESNFLRVTFPINNKSQATVYLSDISTIHLHRGFIFEGMVLDDVTSPPEEIYNKSGWLFEVRTPRELEE